MYFFGISSVKSEEIPKKYRRNSIKNTKKMKHKNGIKVDGSLPSAGVTLYTRQGQTIIRAATSHQPLRRTQQQFAQRERLAHNNNLWKVVKSTSFITYAQFCALAAKLPALYLTCMEHFEGYTLLLPGIPVACGTLPDIGQRLGSVEGSPALLTDLQPELLTAADRLVLVTLEQVCYGGQPQLAADSEAVPRTAFTVVDGRLALVDSRFGDDRFGWALVRRRRDLCSTQTVVTAATAYRQYLTPEARQRAAESYGGLTAL